MSKLVWRGITEDEKKVLKEWLDSVAESPGSAPIVSLADRQKIVELWMDPAYQYDVKKIAEAVGLPEAVTATIIGSHPMIREIETAKHRARLYEFRSKLDALQGKVHKQLERMLDSTSREDLAIALHHLRQYAAAIDAQLKLTSADSLSEDERYGIEVVMRAIEAIE